MVLNMKVSPNSFPKYLSKELKRPSTNTFEFLALDLFAGCGGLALGFEANGFKTFGIESNFEASESYNTNLSGNCINDTLAVGYSYPLKNPDIIIGGPPCQPFSVGGYQNGLMDSRDGFPIFLDVVSRLKPKIAIFENVKGMLYKNKFYLMEIIEKLMSYNYIVEHKVLNAVDFKVPQNRERLFVVAHKGGWEWPTPFSTKFTAGDALGAMATEIPNNAKFLTKSMDTYVAKYEKKSKCINPRDLYLDRPARTVTCRNLNGATGDMHRVRLPDGRRRRLTVKEGARLQSFPDWFNFYGNEGSQFNQIGNAVPPLLASAIAKSASVALKAKTLSKKEILSANQPDQLEFNIAKI